MQNIQNTFNYRKQTFHLYFVRIDVFKTKMKILKYLSNNPINQLFIPFNKLISMGLGPYKEKLNNFIEKDKPDSVILLLQKRPEIINLQLSSQNHHTPLLRAIWKQNYVIAKILLSQFNPNPNLFGGKYTPLMIAAIRGNVQLIELLLQFKADPSIITSDGLNAMDYSILFGQYNASFYLKNKSKIPIKTVAEAFENRRQKLNLPFVNYKIIIELLLNNVPYEQAVKLIYKNPLSESQPNNKTIKLQEKEIKTPIIKKKTSDISVHSVRESKLERMESYKLQSPQISDYRSEIKLQKKKSDLISTTGQISTSAKKKPNTIQQALQLDQ